MNTISNKKIIKTVKFLSIIPITLFVYNLIKLSNDIPLGDDYPAILKFLSLYIRANTFLEKFNLFFALHAEHQIFLCKFISLLTFKFFGSINFTFLIYIGNISILGIVLLLYKNFIFFDSLK